MKGEHYQNENRDFLAQSTLNFKDETGRTAPPGGQVM